MICPECGFSYSPDFLEDIRLHDNYHDKIVKGIPLFIKEEMDDLVFAVNHSSPFHRKKIAEKVGIIANLDTPYDSCPYSVGEIRDERDVHIFMYPNEGRVIGYLLIEKRTNIWKCNWEQFEKKQASEVSDFPFLWTIGLIWIHKNHRRNGIAKTMIKEAANYFGLEIQDLGWYAPPITESGEIMLRSILPNGYYIAK